MTQTTDYHLECKNYLDLMLKKYGKKAFDNKDFIRIAFEYEYSSDFWRDLAIKHGEPLINWTLKNFNNFPYDDYENFTEFFIKAKKPHLVSFIWKNKHFKEKHLNEVTSSYAYSKFNEAWVAFEHGNYDIIKFLWEDPSCFTDFSSDLINDFDNNIKDLFFTSLINNNPNALHAFIEICKDWFSKNKSEDDYHQYIYKLAYSILPKENSNLKIINPITLEYLLFYSDIREYFNIQEYFPLILRILPEVKDDFDLQNFQQLYNKMLSTVDFNNEQLYEASLLESVKQENIFIFNDLFHKNRDLSKVIIQKSSLSYLYNAYQANPQNIDFLLNLFNKEHISIQEPVKSDFFHFLSCTIYHDLPLSNLFKIIDKDQCYEYIKNNIYECINFSLSKNTTFDNWIDILLKIHNDNIVLTDEQKFHIITCSLYQNFSPESLNKVINNQEYEDIIIKKIKKIISSYYEHINDILNYSNYSDDIINAILSYSEYNEFKNISDTNIILMFENIQPESYNNDKTTYLKLLLDRIDLKKIEDIENHNIYKFITQKMIDNIFNYDYIKECDAFKDNKNIQTLLSFVYLNNKYSHSKKEKKNKI